MHSTPTSVNATHTSRVFVVANHLVMVTWEEPLTVVTTDQQGALHICVSTSETPTPNESIATVGELGELSITASASFNGLDCLPLKPSNPTTPPTSGPEKS